MVEQSNVLSSKVLKLMKDTGYPLVQQNGERKFGPPPEWTGLPPPKGCEVFVGGLPRKILEDELVPIFGNCGTIYEMRLMMNFSGFNRGYAFVNYTNRNDASRAVQELDGLEIRQGRNIGVLKSINNCRLFLGNIPEAKTKGQLYVEASKWVSGIVDVIMSKNQHNQKRNRGFAFVEFVSHHAAALARRALVLVKLWNIKVTVDWAKPNPKFDIDDDDDQIKMDLDKKEYVNSPKEALGVGSAYGGTPCGSATNIPQDMMMFPQSGPTACYTLAPLKLDSVCNRYKWAAPVYQYQKYMDPRGFLVWVGMVELPQVGLPLLNVPRRIGPLITTTCYSMQQAQVQAAECALNVIRKLQTDQIQEAPRMPVQPVHSSMVPTVPSYMGFQYNYKNASHCRQLPIIPVVLWRGVHY